MRILRLPIKGRWRAQIDAGIKGDEYREIKAYYIPRFFENRLGRESITGMLLDLFEEAVKCTDDVDEEAANFGYRIREYDAVELIEGYGRKAPRSLYEWKGLSVGYGRTAWGAPADKKVFIIHLGNKITNI